MHAITATGLDIAKSVFQVHGVDAEGKVVFRRTPSRRCPLGGINNKTHGNHNESAQHPNSRR